MIRTRVYIPRDFTHGVGSVVPMGTVPWLETEPSGAEKGD